MAGVDQAKLEQAASADSTRIAALLHDPSPQVVSALLRNSNISEDDVLVIATRKNLPPGIFTEIAGDRRWSESYPIRRALASNPKTPLSVSLSIVRYLRLFDLAEMARSPHLPLIFRKKIEAIIAERIPTMALGLRKTLSKIAVGDILFKLLQTRDAEVIESCLANPRLLESHLYKLLGRRELSAETVMMIAEHRNWSLRPLVRYALVRSEHLPLQRAGRFLQSMTIQEMRDLYADPALPAATRPLVHRELLSRGQNPGVPAEDKEFEISEEDDIDLHEFQGCDDEEHDDGAA